MNEKYIQLLRDAILKSHGCGSRYIQTVAVKEEIKGFPAWEGKVELFDLAGHATARHCYAWGHKNEEGRWLYEMELNPPSKSAVEAVRAYITRNGKQGAGVR